MKTDLVGEIQIYSGEMELIADLDKLIEFKRERLEAIIDNVDTEPVDPLLVWLLFCDYWSLLCDAGYIDKEAIQREMEEEEVKI